VVRSASVTARSPGSATRTFCYIADAITGYYKILVNGRNGEAYNIGTEKPEVSIADFAKKVVSISRDLFNYNGNVVFETSSDKDYLTHNPNRRCPVITKARDELGYSPGISLDEGLKRSMIWYSDNRTAGDA